MQERESHTERTEAAKRLCYEIAEMVKEASLLFSLYHEIRVGIEQMVQERWAQIDVKLGNTSCN